MKKKTGLRVSISGTILCWLAAVIILLPLLYVLIVSVSDQKSLNKDLFSFLYEFHPENYIVAWKKGNIVRFCFNSVIVCAATVLIDLFAGSWLAFATRMYKRFREIGTLYYIIMTGMFIPVQAIVLPLFKIIKALNLLNQPIGLALVYAGINLPLSMMMFAGYYKSIPMELTEAASIDGCNPFRIFFSIILPLTKPILSTVSILVSLTVWRDMFIPLMLTTDVKARTVAYGLMSFVNEFSLDWTNMCAAMVITTLPIIVLFLCLQKYFISGTVAGAVKG